jgi:hypothetical protein
VFGEHLFGTPKVFFFLLLLSSKNCRELILEKKEEDAFSAQIAVWALQ